MLFPRYYWPVGIYTVVTDALFSAIYARYLTTPLADKITALYNTQAAESAIEPYGVFSLPSNVPDGTFTEDYEDYLIQFVLYSKETLSTEILDAFGALKAAYDKHDLVISEAETISLEREPANLLRVEEKWRYAITYRLLIQKG